MINDSNLINEIIKQIENIKFQELNLAIEMADKYFNNAFEVKTSYVNENNYTFSKELNNYNNIHIDTKKHFLDFFKRKKQENIDNLEAA